VSEKKENLVRNFDAISDDGNSVSIQEYEILTNVTTLADKEQQWVRTRTRFQTKMGIAVNFIPEHKAYRPINQEKNFYEKI